MNRDLTKELRVMAKQVFDLGVAAYNSGDYETAAKRFERAYEMDNTFSAARDMLYLANRCLEHNRQRPKTESARKVIDYDPNGKVIAKQGDAIIWYDQSEELYKLLEQMESDQNGVGNKWVIAGVSTFKPREEI